VNRNQAQNMEQHLKKIGFSEVELAESIQERKKDNIVAVKSPNSQRKLW
jgi:NACalpha-BTF3-like transcription factor